MAIKAECGECGNELNVSFSIDSDGDGAATVDRCECMDEDVSNTAVEGFMENGMWDYLSEYVNDNPEEMLDYPAVAELISEGSIELAETIIDERIIEEREALAKEVISNIVGKYEMIPKEVADKANITATSIKSASYAFAYGAGSSTIKKTLHGECRKKKPHVVE